MITGQEFEVNRRIYVDFEGISPRRKYLTGLEPELISVMIGMSISFCFLLVALYWDNILGMLIIVVDIFTVQDPCRLTNSGY